VPEMKDALRAALRARGFAPPYHLLAMSLGAMIAIAWASDHPNDVAGAVLINTSVGGPHPFYRRLRPGAWWRLIGIALPGLTDADRESAILRLTSEARARSKVAIPLRVAYRRERPVALRNVLRQLIAAARFQAPGRAPLAPLLVLSGARDRLVDPTCSRRLARAWHTAYAEHPDAGHDLALDDPAWVVEQVRGWPCAAVAAPERHETAANR
jgi:pimeloyl-ACP methyl ester carboxylesterase